MNRIICGSFFAMMFLGMCADSLRAQTAPAPTSVKIIDLGVLPGLPGSVFTGASTARAINNAGVVVGDSTTVTPDCPEVIPPGLFTQHAFRWTPDIGIQDLGISFDCQSSALGISDDGHIVGSTFLRINNGQFSLSVPRAALWSPGGAQSGLGTGTPPLCNGVFPGNCNVYASGINPADGSVVGAAYGPGGISSGFIWRQGQGFQDLEKNIFPFAINSSGVMACLDANAGPANQVACLRKPDGTIVDLAASGTLCEALALNANSEAVGYCQPPSGNAVTAMFWDSTGGGQTLGVNGFPQGINAQGVVVGENEDSPGSAFMWTKTKGLVYLSTLLPPGSGWRLDHAYAINDHNQIVGAGLHNGAQRAFLLNLSPCMDAGGDTDGDGLCDDWEKNGVFVNVNGKSVFLDLPAMGADPNHKDVFVQLDTIGNGTVTQAALDIVIAAFANASVSNPDHTTGITLHVDNGPNSIMNPVTGAQWGDLSRAFTASGVANLGNIAADNSFSWDGFDALKKLAAFERAPAFHYAISEPVLIFYPDGVDNASGISRGIGASDFIVALPPNIVPSPGNTHDNEVAGTFMHELGHNLGLRHGGGDDNNSKPNYLSIMNYAFQFPGLGPGHVYDYSRFGPDSDLSHRLPVLDETHLNETTGLGTPSQPVGANALRYSSYYFCPGDDQTPKVIKFLNHPIDWNCNGDFTETDVAAEVNGEPSEDKVDGGKPILLSPYDDWAHLVFNGGDIGSLAGAPLPSMTQNTEPTLEQLQKFADFWAAQEQPQDNIPPTTIVMLSPLPNAADWNNSNVIVTLNSMDNPGGSGVKQITYSANGAQTIASTVPLGAAASFTISAEGTTTVTFFGTDNAGNIEAAKTLTIRLDKTPPSITGTRTPSPNANGWNNTAVSVSFQCADSLSGLAPGSPPAATVLSAEGAGQSVVGICTDVAGNSATSTVSGINIDKTSPVITVSANPTTLWPPNGKMVTVKVSGTMADNLSGVNPSTADFAVKDAYGFVQPSGPVSVAPNGAYSFTVSLEARRNGQDKNGRLYTITVNAQDNAGNAGSATTTIIVPHDQGN